MSFRFILGAASVLLAASCKQSTMIELKPIPDAAYAKGVSAPFCGTIQGVPVVAGGANFPDKPLLEGGAKRVYQDIWTYQGEAWVRAGLLPDSTAYGATFQLPNALVLAGGNVCGETTDKVYLLSLEAGKAVLETLPSLPLPMEQYGWTQEADKLYLAGTEGVFCCTVGDFHWEKMADVPQPLVQPVLYAREGVIFLWGGFNPQTLAVSGQGWCLEDGQWKEAPAVPDGGTFVGAAGATLPDGRLAVVGGVNREIFAKALHNGPEERIPYLSQEPAWYRFRQAVYLFDGKAWQQAAAHPFCALAGPGVAAYKEGVLIAGGECKPGVRSPRIFCIKW